MDPPWRKRQKKNLGLNRVKKAAVPLNFLHNKTIKNRVYKLPYINTCYSWKGLKKKEN